MNKDKFAIPALGALGINSVNLTDRTFGKSSNTVADLIRSVETFAAQVPIAADPISFRPVVAADLVAYDPALVVGVDSIAVLKTAVTNDFRAQLNPVVANVGVLITQRFITNVVSGPYTIIRKSFAQDGVIGSLLDQWTRELVASPEGGANTVCEYAIINMISSMFLAYNDVADAYDDGRTKRQAYMAAEKFINDRQASTDAWGYTDSTIYVLKGQVTIPQQTSMVPIFCHAEAPQTVADLFAAAMGIQDHN